MFHWIEISDRVLVCLETGARVTRKRDGIIELWNGIRASGMNIEQEIYIPANEHDAQSKWNKLKAELGVK